MVVSPTNVSVPLIAPSVNVHTEQVTRDNRVKEPVAATEQMAKAAADRKLKKDDKRRQQSAWDPAEHPSYEDPHEELAHEERNEEAPLSDLEKLFELLSLASYSESQGKGYAMRYRLPRRIIDAVISEGQMAQRRTVIKFHYGQSIAPNTPSEVIAIL